MRQKFTILTVIIDLIRRKAVKESEEENEVGSDGCGYRSYLNDIYGGEW